MTAVGSTCGCMAGDPYNGWLEIRSSYCKADEIRQFTTAMGHIRKVLAERKGKK